MTSAPEEMRTSFLTVVTANRRYLFRAETYAWLMHSVLQQHRYRGAVRIHAYVLMPDHIHLLLTPTGIRSIEQAIEDIKSDFSAQLSSSLQVWARGFEVRRILTATAFDGCKRYIERNPVRAGLTPLPERFAFSSASTGAQVDPCPAWFGAEDERPSPLPAARNPAGNVHSTLNLRTRLLRLLLPQSSTRPSFRPAGS